MNQPPSDVKSRLSFSPIKRHLLTCGFFTTISALVGGGCGSSNPPACDQATGQNCSESASGGTGTHVAAVGGAASGGALSDTSLGGGGSGGALPPVGGAGVGGTGSGGNGVGGAHRGDGGTGAGGAGSGGVSSDGSGGSGTGGVLGDDNPFSPITNGSDGFSTRYWDCCKQHCAWGGRLPHQTNSCDSSGENPSLNDEKSVCDNGGGVSATCNNTAPWAHSTQVAFGYAAVPFGGDFCGNCYQLEFTGEGNSGPDPGSAALQGKTMVVMATNTGDISQPGHFDLLIPGGGVGLMYGCNDVWGLSGRNDPLLGAERGGLLTTCKQQVGGEDLGAIKACVAQKCDDLFGSRGLPDMMASCMWFVDWFEAADNPKFKYQEISCPAELSDLAY